MNDLWRWDREALLWINSHHNPVLDAILYPISLAGEAAIFWFALCIVFLIFGKREHRMLALTFIVTVAVVDRLIAAQLAHYFPRERPYLAMDWVRHMGVEWKGSSFPSGHAHSVWIAAFIFGDRWHKLIIPLVVFGLLTCYSRPYLGMHYPGDVLAGSVLGIAAGWTVVAARHAWFRRKRKVEANEG